MKRTWARTALATFGVCVALCMTGSLAHAATLAFSGKGYNKATDNTLAATVLFSYDGGSELTIQLTNNTEMGALAPSDVLTALFFDVKGEPAMKPLYAKESDGSFVRNAPDSYSLGSEWDFEPGVEFKDLSQIGLGSAGFGIFNKGNFASPGENVQGMDYGIINYVNEKANKPVQTGVFVQNSITFGLAVDPATFSLKGVTNVYFQFGTDLSEPRFEGLLSDSNPNPVPEPGTLTLLAGLGSGAFATLLRRKSARRRSISPSR